METVAQGSNVGYNASLALDGQNWAHMSYFDGTTEQLKYAWWNGVIWQTETLTGERGRGADAVLLANSGNIVHIAFGDRDGHLIYGRRETADWQFDTVDGAAFNEFPSLALDLMGGPHISYNARSNLKYAWREGTTWHVETVTGLCGSSSLVVDNLDVPHIACTLPNNALVYAWHDGTTWRSQRLMKVRLISPAWLLITWRGRI